MENKESYYRRGLYAVLLVSLGLFLAFTSITDTSHAEATDEVVHAGNEEYGIATYTISTDGELKTARLTSIELIGTHIVPGENVWGSFVVPKYLRPSGDDYQVIFEGSGESGDILVNSIKGNLISGNYSTIVSTDTEYYNENGNKKTVKNTTEFNQKFCIVIPETISLLGTQSFPYSTVYPIFSERTSDTLTIERRSIPVRDGEIRFPDHCLIAGDAGSGSALYDTWFFGKDTQFIAPAEGNRTIMARTIYTETSFIDLLKGLDPSTTNLFVTSDTSPMIYQIVTEGIVTNDSNYYDSFGGYYFLSNDKPVVVHEILNVGTQGEPHNLFFYYTDDTKDAIETIEASADSGNTTVILHKKNDASCSIQLIVDGQAIREDAGTYAFNTPAPYSLITIELTRWKVDFMNGSDQFATTYVVDGGMAEKPKDIPSQTDRRFLGWGIDDSVFDFTKPITSDLSLSASWGEEKIYRISYELAFGTMTAAGSQIDEYGQIPENAQVTLTYCAPEKMDMRSWILLTDTGKIEIEPNQTVDGYILSPDGRTLTIAALTTNIKLSINAIYVSEAAPTPEISTDAPTDNNELVLKWSIGTGQLEQNHFWGGGPSEILILDDYVYVHEGEAILKIEASTGLVKATAESKLIYAYYHRMGYLGNGLIKDYTTQKIFDMDLKEQNFTISGESVFDADSRFCYTFNKTRIAKYDPYKITADNITSDGKLKPLWEVPLNESQRVFNNFVSSQPIIVGDTIYWISTTGTNVQSSEVSICWTSGESVDSVRLPGLDRALLDNGWLTTDGKNLYVTSYTYGLFPSDVPGNSALAVMPLDGPEPYYYDLPGSRLASAFVTSEDYGFLKIGNELHVYDLANLSTDGTALTSIAKTSVPDISHGSITVNSRYSDEGKYYVYFAGYSTGVLYICEFDALSNTVSCSKEGKTWSNSSQGVKSTASGDLIYYVDSGTIVCYTHLDRNEYTFIINDGEESLTYVVIEKDAVSALESLGIATISNNILIAAGTTQDTQDTGYTLYGMIKGAWVTAKYNSFSNIDDCRYWYISKNTDSVPEPGSSWNLAETGEQLTLDYVKGYKITVEPGGYDVTYEVVSIPGTVVAVYLTGKSVAQLEGVSAYVYSENDFFKATLSGDGVARYGFIMPESDVRVSIGTVQEYSVELSSEGEGTASVSTDEAAEGLEVIITTTPDIGYKVSEITCVADGNNIAVTPIQPGYSFIMPASDTTIRVVFERDPSITLYTVSFITEHGEAPSPTIAVAGGTVKLLTLTTDAYNFEGWKVNGEKIDGETYTVDPAHADDNDVISLEGIWSLKIRVNYHFGDDAVVDLGQITVGPNLEKIANTYSGCLVKFRLSSNWDPSGKPEWLTRDGQEYSGIPVAEESKIKFTGRFYITPVKWILSTMTVTIKVSPANDMPDGDTIVIWGLPGGITNGDKEFKGWSKQEDGSTVDYSGGEEFELTNVLNLYAVWQEPEPVEYTILFTTEHGEAPPSDTALAGESVTLPKLIAETYNFDGWMVDSEKIAGESYIVDPAHANEDNIITFEAIWSLKNRVNYHLGSGATVNKGTVATNSTSEDWDAYEGCELVFILPLNWTILNTPNWLVVNGLECRGIPTEGKTILTLTGSANPTGPPRQVFKNLNISTHPLSDYGENIVIRQLPAGITNGDKEFKGWSKQENSSIIEYTGGEQETLTGSMDLYAVWAEPGAIAYTVSFITEHGEIPSSETALAGGSITLPTLATDGFEFGGWKVNSQKIEGETYIVDPAHANVDNIITLEGTWLQKFSVNYHLGPGAVLDMGQVASDATNLTWNVYTDCELRFIKPLAWPTIEKPSWLTEENRIFSGIPPEGESKVTIYGSVRIGTMWQSIYKTITIIASPLTDASADTVEVRQLPEGITNGDKGFKGWSKQENGTVADYTGGEQIALTGSMDLYAVWAEPVITYTVSFTTEHGNAPPSQTALAGETVTLPTLAADDFEFGGWKVNSQKIEGETYIVDPAHANVDNIITLEGIWSVSGPTEYTIEGEIQTSNTENTFLLNLNPPSRPIEFEDARLLIIASYSGGNHISIYSKVGLDDTGRATEKIAVSNTGLISLTAFLVDGLVYDGTSCGDYRWTGEQGS